MVTKLNNEEKAFIRFAQRYPVSGSSIKYYSCSMNATYTAIVEMTEDDKVIVIVTKENKHRGEIISKKVFP